MTSSSGCPTRREASYGGHMRVNGIRQHYVRFPGPGPRVIIVPGIVSPAALWEHIARGLMDNWDIWVLDVRGRGLSEQAPGLDYGLDACARDLEAFILASGATTPIVVGHSMGGRIGALLASRTSLVGALVMLDPPASAPDTRPYPIPAERTVALVEAARRGEGDTFLRRPGVTPWPEPLLRQRAEWLATCNPAVISPAYRDFHEHNIYEHVAKTECPVTLVVAGASGVINANEVARFQRYQPKLHVIMAHGAAHQLQAENTALCLEILEQALAHAAQHIAK